MWLSESASYGCDHHYSPIFFIVHKSSEAFACAPCLVRSCVSEIKSAQAGLEACGGVLFSKISGQKDGMDHKGWRTKLRSDKIRCYNVVRRTPGYQYVDDQSRTDLTLRTPKRQKRRGHDRLDQSQVPVLPECPGWLNSNALNTNTKLTRRMSPPPSVSHGDSSTHSALDVIMCENKSVYRSRSAEPKDVKDVSSKHSYIETEHDGRTNPQALVVRDFRISTLVTGVASRTPVASDANSANISKPQPTRIATTSLPPGIRRQVTFDPCATILPHNTVPSTVIIKKPHNPHTSYQERHHRASLNRRLDPQLDRMWTSPSGYVKPDTSHFRTSWVAYEQLQRKLNGEETEAQEQSVNPALQDSVIDAKVSAGIEKRENRSPRVVLPYNLNIRRGSKMKTEPGFEKKVRWSDEESEH